MNANCLAAEADGVRGEAVNIAEASATYAHLFEFLMWTGIIAGVALLLISPILKKGMHGIR